MTFDSFAETFEDGEAEIQEMLKDLVERFTALMEEKDKICVTFSHNSFSYPIVKPFVYKADFTFDLIEAYFYNVRKSYKYSIISIADSLQAKVQIAKIPSGSGRRKMEEWEKKPKKIYYVKKKDRNGNDNINSEIKKLTKKELSFFEWQRKSPIPRKEEKPKKIKFYKPNKYIKVA